MIEFTKNLVVSSEIKNIIISQCEYEEKNYIYDVFSLDEEDFKEIEEDQNKDITISKEKIKNHIITRIDYLSNIYLKIWNFKTRQKSYFEINY